MSHLLWSNPFANGEEEITNKVTEILRTGAYQVRLADGAIVLRGEPSGSTETPWIHIMHGPERVCSLWNAIYTRGFDLIPSFCRFRCWKTVVKPRNVVELFRLEAILTGLQLPSKCGIDIRDYTPGAYAGFIYGNSLEEGREYFKIITRVLVEQGMGDVPVLLKRGCTEMELMKPSDQWDPMSEKDKLLEEKLDFIFARESFAQGVQSQWIKNRIRRRWVRHAMAIGDATWKQIVGPDVKGMHPHVVQYQSEESFEATKSKPIDQLHEDCLNRVKEKK
jgi:hypothetical protein